MKEFFVNLFGAVWSAIKWSFSSFGFGDVLDILIITFIAYEILVWVRRTKAFTLLKGIGVLLLAWGLAKVFELKMTVWIFEKALSVGILAIVIIFQPELRRGLERLGQGSFLTKFIPETSRAASLSPESAEEIITALHEMAKVKTGALICIEENDRLTQFAATGIKLDSTITSQLFINIFEKNTPLHDGAVIISNDRVAAATCYLPLTENNSISKELGTRHRAAIGLSEETDSLTLVVSEETGQISMAEKGKIYRNISDDFIRDKLLGTSEAKTKEKLHPRSLKGLLFGEKEQKP